MDQLQKYFHEASVLVIGVSNGFSRAEGLDLTKDETKHTDLRDYMHAYGFTKLVDAIIGPWPSIKEEWIFYSLLTKAYSLDYQETEIMRSLKSLIGDKPYFIVSSVAESHFMQAGFQRKRIYDIAGNWLTMTNSVGEDLILEDARAPLRRIVNAYCKGEEIDSLIPLDHNNHPMRIQTAGFETMRIDPQEEQNYFNFVDDYHGKNMLILELGANRNNVLIKRPLMKLAYHEPNAVYVTLNDQDLWIAQRIREKSFGYQGSLTKILGNIAQACR